MRGLSGSEAKNEIQTGSRGEGSEVIVSRYQWDRVVNTGLRNQCVTEAGLATSRQYPGSQQPSPLPVARIKIE